jgi:hypothetical protein
MATKPGFWEYCQSAFNARPIGMFVPPNWVGLGVFGILGLVSPGFWLMGLGLELAYLGVLSTNERFQRTVTASQMGESKRQWQGKIDGLIDQLASESQRSYRALELRCRSILEQQAQSALGGAALDAQGEGLGRLLWIYLRLLLTRQSIDRIVREGESSRNESGRLDERIAELQRRLKEESPGEDLKKSLAAQLEILQQRLEKRKEAKEKLAFMDAELARIQEQVELVREQAVLTTQPETVSQRIDQITSTLGGTTQWISEQQKLYGAVEDLMAEPPPLAVGLQSKQSQ